MRPCARIPGLRRCSEKSTWPVEAKACRLYPPIAAGVLRGISCHYKRGDCLMIDAKQAVQIAKARAAEILNQASSNLEEIERDSYKDREVWSITLSMPRDITMLAPFAQL